MIKKRKKREPMKIQNFKNANEAVRNSKLGQRMRGFAVDQLFPPTSTLKKPKQAGDLHLLKKAEEKKDEKDSTTQKN